MAVPSDQSRIYKPLQTWQTRILRLHPAASLDKPLHGDVLTAGLAHGQRLALSMDSELITFEAISYAWGTWAENELVSMVCNGVEVKITPSLADALQRFRYGDRARYLWADALCIDQGNSDEKSVQVSNTFDIFHKATTVLVWLGRGNADTTIAMDHICALPSRSSSPELSLYLQKSTSKGLPPALKYLYTRTWLRRVWVQKEVFVANEIVVFCGQNACSFTKYRDFGIALGEELDVGDRPVLPRVRASLSVLALINPNSASDVAQLAERRWIRQQLGGIPVCEPLESLQDNAQLPVAKIRPGSNTDYDSRRNLLKVLARGNNTNASDSRDFVYALLGLTDSLTRRSSDKPGDVVNDKISLIIDYTRSVAEVFTDVTRYIMESTDDLTILSMHRPWAVRGSPGIPSWVVTWGSNGSFS
ncbi:hypothetical protein LTR86_001378 [Recurvomyces mirabilis]|nr:hypothetical protein LTR86_001378 [Recurvomyces mirabilis]